MSQSEVRVGGVQIPPELVNVHAVFLEALRQAGISKRGRLKVRPAVVTMKKALLSGTTSDSDSFRVPSEEVFLVKEIRGHFSFNALAAEALGLTNITPMTVGDYVIGKARNCNISLERADQNLAVTLGSNLCLADILPGAGGQAIRFDEMGPVWVIPPSETLKMTASLISTTAAIVGQSSNYGVMLSGAMLSIVG